MTHAAPHEHAPVGARTPLRLVQVEDPTYDPYDHWDECEGEPLRGAYDPHFEDLPDEGYVDVPLCATEAADLVSRVDSALAPVVAEQRAAGALLPKWDEADYAPGGNVGSGAWKLGDSAVAPLVAAARGYETISEDGYAHAVKKHSLPRRNSAQGRRIAESTARGDLLIMPWFTTQDLATANRSSREAVPSTTQYRPARPAMDEKTGREMKYEFVGGQKTPVGVHPSYRREWIDSAPTILLAEGLLKGDSALTGYLLDAGVSPESLAFDGVGGTTVARARLAAMLDSIPQDRRIVILTIAGVWNWRNNSEWVDLDLKGRQTWVGVDGDVASNPHVFKACTELWDFLTEKKKTTASLLAPTLQASDGDKKVGIDDYLAKYGNWRGLISMLAPGLPTAPPGNDLENVGSYRANPGTGYIEVCEGVNDDPFNPNQATRGNWVKSLPFAPTFVGAWRLRDDLNGGHVMQVYDIEIRIPTPSGVESYIAELVPHAQLKDPEVWLERAGVPFPGWSNDRKCREIVYGVLMADANRNGLVMEDMLRRTGYHTNSEGRTAFALQRATITGDGYRVGGGAFFRPGSDEAKIDMSVLADASEDNVRHAVSDYLRGMRHFTDPTWYVSEIGLASWMHMGMRPHGSVMLVGAPGSGKSTGSRLHTSRYGSRFPRMVIFGKSMPQVADSGKGLHNLLVTLDDYKPNSNIEADRATCEGLEVVTRRGYEEEAGRTTKERDELSTNGWSQGSSDQTTPGFFLQGEQVPALWGRSSLQRVMVLHHEHDHYVEGGADAIKALARTGCANLATAAFIQHQCRRIDYEGLGLDGWAGHYEAALDRLKSQLVNEIGWDPRYAEIVVSIVLGWRAFLSFAKHIDAISEEEHDGLRHSGTACLIAAMTTHLNRYLPTAEDPSRLFINAIKSAGLRGEARILAKPNEPEHFRNVIGFHYKDRTGDEWVCLDAGATAAALDSKQVDVVASSLRSIAKPWERQVKGRGGKVTTRVDYTRTVRTNAFSDKSQAPVYWVPLATWNDAEHGDEVEDLRDLAVDDGF